MRRRPGQGLGGSQLQALLSPWSWHGWSLQLMDVFTDQEALHTHHGGRSKRTPSFRLDRLTHPPAPLPSRTVGVGQEGPSFWSRWAFLVTTLKPPRSPPRAAFSEQKALLSPRNFQGGERAVSEAEGRDPVSATLRSAENGRGKPPLLAPKVPWNCQRPGVPRPVPDLFTAEDGWCSGMTPCGLGTHRPARAARDGPGRRPPSHSPRLREDVSPRDP